MSTPKPQLPKINETERTPVVDALLELVAWQSDRIEKLEQVIIKLKGETAKPVIQPSKMDQETSSPEAEEEVQPRKRGPKRQKTAELRIDTTIRVEPETLPEGSRFKGYRPVIIQDLRVESFNTCYELAQYQTPAGTYVSGVLPEHLKGRHFGPTLISFIQHQYHHQHVTQPLLLEFLHELGVEISAGQLNHLLTEDLTPFHQEKEDLLRVGLRVSSYLHTDDTGARHQGKTGYCTQIGNEQFAWFSSTDRKSRINFLELLSQGVERRYVINADAWAYMKHQKLPKSVYAALADTRLEILEETAWNTWLDDHGIQTPRHRRIMTEGALIGGLLAQGIPRDLSLISDDAGQFNVFDHALCWIHAERGINRLIPLNEGHAQAVEWARSELWGIYADLKAYKLTPTEAQADAIRHRFQALCHSRTVYETLNQVLKRLGNQQQELLRVLDKPELPLHNNLSERDLRDYVKKRKISGGTRSDAGRKARDTFASLKQTCRKHGLSFWNYLKDRALGKGEIPRLAELIRDAATCG